MITWEQRNEYLVRVENKPSLFTSNPLHERISTPHPLPLPHIQDKTCIMETEETSTDLSTSEIEIVTSTNCESGEFYLEMAEWDNIRISSNGRMSLINN